MLFIYGRTVNIINLIMKLLSLMLCSCSLPFFSPLFFGNWFPVNVAPNSGWNVFIHNFGSVTCNRFKLKMRDPKLSGEWDVNTWPLWNYFRSSTLIPGVLHSLPHSPTCYMHTLLHCIIAYLKSLKIISSVLWSMIFILEDDLPSFSYSESFSSLCDTWLL